MEQPTTPIAFLGDLADPWVARIADGLPPSAARLHQPGDLPDTWPVEVLRASTVVIHRPHAGEGDRTRLATLRHRLAPTDRILLCLGPHARYQQLERWLPLVDAVLPEATAPDVLGRHLAPGRTSQVAGAGVVVISSNFEMRAMLAEACRRAGFPEHPASSWAEADDTEPIAVWDVPILEPGWPAELARQSARRRVVALCGFPDRDLAGRLKQLGAVACLDLPCDPADLAYVLDRINADLARTARRHVDRGHKLPTAPHRPPAGRPAWSPFDEGRGRA